VDLLWFNFILGLNFILFHFELIIMVLNQKHQSKQNLKQG